MGNATVGAKAGAVAGVVYGIILGLLSYISIAELKDTIMQSIASALPQNSPITADETYQIALVVGPAFAVIAGVVVGVIFGVIYGALFNRLPGKSDLTKAVVLGLIFWLLISVLGGLGDLNYGVLYYGGGVVEGLVVALFFSYLLARFYRRFSPKPEQLPQTTSL